MDEFSPGFEECHHLRTAYIRSIILDEIENPGGAVERAPVESAVIPRRLVRYWHDPANLPTDVRACLDSWDRLVDEGFDFIMFDDESAAAYIAETYGEQGRKAFARCAHPAMRCDYLRMCFLLAEGGLYVDADDVLIGEGWRSIFGDGRLKVQPLCYDLGTGGMMPAAEIWKSDLSLEKRIFYVNNDPIATPAGHPILQRALTSATQKLLDVNCFPEIQSTTGPGNFTAALAAHARHLQLSGLPFDFQFLRDWEAIAEMRWNLTYRCDARNWRNFYGC
ncbi:MAG: hypothetical protein KIS61_23135 [Candidatus Eremiobacteraeota bacterium]|nr:hypothetical protein [Candidatus Eremiobacteraeota bacterium]